MAVVAYVASVLEGCKLEVLALVVGYMTTLVVGYGTS